MMNKIRGNELEQGSGINSKSSEQDYDIEARRKLKSNILQKPQELNYYLLLVWYVTEITSDFIPV